MRSLFSIKLYAQCFLDAAVGVMNTPKAVSLATSATERYGVQIKVIHSPLIITSSLAHNTDTTSWIFISKRNKSLDKIRPKECTVYTATKDYNFVKPYWCRRCVKIKSNTMLTVYNLKWMIIILINYGCRNMEVLDILRHFIGFGRSKDL